MARMQSGVVAPANKHRLHVQMPDNPIKPCLEKGDPTGIDDIIPRLRPEEGGDLGGYARFSRQKTWMRKAA